MEGVISLPGGVFQPYTGVKTSVLIFRKETKRDDKQSLPSNAAPRTDYVWFYEVEEDGYSKDAKRNPRPGQQNDLWDALEKFRAWKEHAREGAHQNEKTMLQPSFWQERWRQALLRDTANELTPAGRAFSELTEASMWEGQVWAIHELFPDLPKDPKEAERLTREAVGNNLHMLAIQHFNSALAEVWESTLTQRLNNTISDQELIARWRKVSKSYESEFKRAARDLENFFEKEDSPGLAIWKQLIKEALINVSSDEHILGILRANHPPETIVNWDFNKTLTQAAQDVAKLDGFDVTLRSLAVDQTAELKAAKHWVVPVRDWARNDEWQSEDAQIVGSHDADGLVRSAYVQAMLAKGLYDDKGMLKDGLLDPDCIEAREWNLSAGQYKPFDFTQLKSDKSVAELIDTLKATEQDIIQGLDKLLAMVEGRE